MYEEVNTKLISLKQI